MGIGETGPKEPEYCEDGIGILATTRIIVVS